METDHAYQKTLEKSFHFIYLLIHAHKHFLYSGIGFRHFYDLICMAQQISSEREWEKITRELEMLNLLEFAKNSMALCERWFGVKSPWKNVSISEPYFTEATETIFQNGVFGFQNEDHDANVFRNAVTNNHFPYWINMLLYWIRSVFPSYQAVREVTYYSWVKGKPWLLPAVWIFRWFYVIKNKARYAIGVLRKPMKKKEGVLKRERQLKDWGL